MALILYIMPEYSSDVARLLDYRTYEPMIPFALASGACVAVVALLARKPPRRKP